MTTPYFGYSSARKSDDTVATIGADWSKAGYVSTSEDADASVFPPNEPVRFTSTDPAYLGKLGTGYLAGAVIGLNQQLGGQGADIIVVRVPEGTGATPAAKLAATHANIIGSAGSQTGLYALRAAPDHVKATPRLVDVPGYDVQQPDGVSVANPVVAALPEHLEALKAVCVVNVAAGSKEAAIAARQTMSSERLVPLGVAGRAYRTINGVATLVTVPLSSYILGLFIRSDNANGGKPFKPIANQAVQGLADISRPIRFSLTDGSSEGQLMLAQDVSVVVRGEGQVDSAADGGFVYIGVESASTDLAWTQFHQIRAYDYLDAKMTVLTRQYLGREITPRVAESWLKSIGFMLEDHVNAEDILGYQINFPKGLNSASEVGLGHLSIETRIQPAPVFRLASNTVRRYPAALDGLVNAIIARAGTQGAIIS